ncbi:hypothetical protein RvY_01249 [Ramazzottius varieornatus]|uniref:Uncharacterized protein n=1 Tax=Ramazzottius varieornatus TaxID=947166 RepID=A0A1D1UQY6_RAMVA|nr:hypothetical protein RvY_01249 [Ramazzottius varieornatus]
MDEHATYRTVRVADVKVHLPSDTDSQMDTVICRFVQQLAAGTRYSALELPDQIYQLQEALWSAMLSFILYKMKIVNHGADQSTEVPVEALSFTGAPSVTPRLLYVCDGVYSVKATISLLHRLKRKLSLPELDCIRITAVGDPADVCSYSKNFRKMHKVSNM